GRPRSAASRASSASAEQHPIDRAHEIFRRSKRKPGSRRTGSGGGCSNRDQGPRKCVNDCGIAGVFLFGWSEGNTHPAVALVALNAPSVSPRCPWFRRACPTPLDRTARSLGRLEYERRPFLWATAVQERY